MEKLIFGDILLKDELFSCALLYKNRKLFFLFQDSLLPLEFTLSKS